MICASLKCQERQQNLELTNEGLKVWLKGLFDVGEKVPLPCKPD
jgi:hypothetical protein